MADTPLISILTPTYNRAGTFLPETIAFIQKQNEKGFTHEHIIVDNGSSDNTEEVVKEFMKDDPRIKYFRSETNLWASGALNLAFEQSKGELIVPFDDDDIMPALSLQVRFDAMQDKKIQWSSGHAIFIDEERQLRGPERLFEYYSNAYPYLDDNNELVDPEGFFKAFFDKWMVCGGTVTIRRECIEQVGGWDPTYTVMQDTEMWTKLASKKFHYKLLNDYLFIYRVHSANLSVSNSKELFNEYKQKLRQKYDLAD
jgi:glycosyltransferase involved in cell wall biosynthesis